MGSRKIWMVLLVATALWANEGMGGDEDPCAESYNQCFEACGQEPTEECLDRCDEAYGVCLEKNGLVIPYSESVESEEGAADTYEEEGSQH